MKGHSVLMSSARQDWQTPDVVLDPVKDFLEGIELDPATTAENPVGALRFYTPEDDGLSKQWDARTVFLNPPYGRGIGRWVSRMQEEWSSARSARSIALVPARTDTRWWQSLYPTAILFWKGRLRFRGAAHAAPFPSALLYWGHHPFRFSLRFRELGQAVMPS